MKEKGNLREGFSRKEKFPFGGRKGRLKGRLREKPTKGKGNAPWKNQGAAWARWIGRDRPFNRLRNGPLQQSFSHMSSHAEKKQNQSHMPHQLTHRLESCLSNKLKRQSRYRRKRKRFSWHRQTQPRNLTRSTVRCAREGTSPFFRRGTSLFQGVFVFRRASLRGRIRFSFPMETTQRKCRRGQAALPWGPQGLQFSRSPVWIT